jgi:hypothetical protein
MMLSKKVTLIAMVVAVILLAIFAMQTISSNTTTNVTTSNLSIQFIKEEVRRVGFGVVERTAADKSESISIDYEGKGLYTLQRGTESIQKEFRLDDDTVKRIRSLITDYGLLSIDMNRDSIEDEDHFIRYTLKVNMDGGSKVIRWTERVEKDPFRPSDVPTLLIRIRDVLLQVMNDVK